MFLNGTRTPHEHYRILIRDISSYMRYFGFDGMSGIYDLKFLPFSKGIDEHPYWLIEKIQFILTIVNKVKTEKRKR